MHVRILPAEGENSFKFYLATVPSYFRSRLILDSDRFYDYTA